MDLAIIGNCAYQALIDSRASVQWLCWPRFDDSFVFGALLDGEKGGTFSIEPAADGVAHEQAYLPNTNVLRTVFRGADGAFEVIDFAPRFGERDHYETPTTLVRIIRPISGAPRLRVRCRPVYDYGRAQPRALIAGNHIEWELDETKVRLTSDAPIAAVASGAPFLLDRDMCLVLTWGEPLETPLVETCEAYLAQTQQHWESWVKRLALPDVFQQEVIRSALTLKLHQFEETGAITAATTTSLPEHPGSGRTWDYRFCWLRDAFFTLDALRRLNQLEETIAFAGFLTNIVASSPARLQPVYAISGESELTETVLEHLAGYDNDGPVRIGNAAYAQIQNDVYGEMVAALAPLLSRGTISEDLIRPLLEHIDRTMEQPDAGLWEIRDEPKLHTFSLLMHWVGATVALRHLGNSKLAALATRLAERARAIIEQRCYRDGFYADADTTDNADAALLMMINLGYLRDDRERATSHLDALATRLRVNDCLLHRYLHDDGIGDTHATFTVCGFWYAEALARVGRRKEAEQCLRGLLRYANHVGLFSEDIDPKSGAQWGNFPQTYSHVGLINTAFALSASPDELL